MAIENPNPRGLVLIDVVEELASTKSIASLPDRGNHDVPMPSLDILDEVMNLLKAVLLPGYFGTTDLKAETMKYHIGFSLDRVASLLWEQVRRGLCYACSADSQKQCDGCDLEAQSLTASFLTKLPEIRRLLVTDIDAAYEGDPAAQRKGETIFCYPSIKAMIKHRVAHELHKLGVPLIPRIIAEQGHSVTGIDIHPGATIGERFFMDHGTGVVIGETSIIGNNVRLYQGVTIGAKSFPMDENGNPIKGVPRHPIIEDDVIIYAGATLLGRITIGKGSVIGGNVWVTYDMPPFSKILQGRPIELPLMDGAGI
jgi:serine O-acetyltransferase